MKQKTGKLTVLTVLLLTVCIAAGALLLPRLLGEAMTLPEAAAPALPGTALGWGWTSCRWKFPQRKPVQMR